MKDRIIQIMEMENLSSTLFAEKLGISKAVVSHILNGRNNPSLDVVSRIIQEMPYINSDWLINGDGKMLKDGYDEKKILQNKDLFANEPLNSIGRYNNSKESPLSIGDETENDVQSIASEQLRPVVTSAKKITQIIIYYDDNTFDTFYSR